MKINWSYGTKNKSININNFFENNKDKIIELPSDYNKEFTDCDYGNVKYITGTITNSDKSFLNRKFTIKENTLVKINNPIKYSEYENIKLDIVYFANLFIHPKAIKLITLQINDLLKTEILQKLPLSNIHIVLCGDNYIKKNIIIDINKLFPEDWQNKKVFIQYHEENCHEYYGIRQVYMSSDKDYVLYFHSKGISRFNEHKRDEAEKRTFDIVIKNWEWVLFILTNFISIDKIGASCSSLGFIWHNFFWIRGNYIKNLERPLKTTYRYYYEFWLGTHLKKHESENIDEKEIKYVDTDINYLYKIKKVYDIEIKNCWNILTNGDNSYNIGDYTEPANSLAGNIL